MQGFWTVQFSGVQGMGARVLTLIGGQIFGGDTSFLYRGAYIQHENKLTAQVHVKRYAPGLPTVMGHDEFDLEFTGTLQGQSITAVATVLGTPLRLNATLSKQGDLPVQ